MEGDTGVKKGWSCPAKNAKCVFGKTERNWVKDSTWIIQKKRFDNAFYAS
jgi:hypothetical protein